MNRLSRKHEYEADRFAAITLRDGKPMEEALVNLTVKNLSNLTRTPGIPPTIIHTRRRWNASVRSVSCRCDVVLYFRSR